MIVTESGNFLKLLYLCITLRTNNTLSVTSFCTSCFFSFCYNFCVGKSVESFDNLFATYCTNSFFNTANFTSCCLCNSPLAICVIKLGNYF